MNACALSALSFAPVQAGRAFDDISTQIRQAMASGVLKPGTRLPPERTLAAQFGVSRNTLREALRSLESSGVLQLRRGAHAGCYICDSSGRGVATGLLDMYKLGGVTPGQLTDARILVETAIVRAACENCTPDDLRELRANVAKAVKLHKEGRVDERLQANLDFHRLLARATHNPLLVMVMEAILDVMRRDHRVLRCIVPLRQPPQVHRVAGQPRRGRGSGGDGEELEAVAEALPVEAAIAACSPLTNAHWTEPNRPRRMKSGRVQCAAATKHGGIVVEAKQADLELVAGPDVIQLYRSDHGERMDHSKASQGAASGWQGEAGGDAGSGRRRQTRGQRQLQGPR
jgi:GntR family transcriptional repressor for pyruvate dehydrogenase complex